MALEILCVVRIYPSRIAAAPAYRVRCTECGSEFIRTGYPSGIKKTRNCSECELRRRAPNCRRYATPKERKRAQNQRYYQRRKLREAVA